MRPVRRTKQERLLSLLAFLSHAGPKSLADVRAAFPDYADGEAGRQMFIRDKKELAAIGGVVEERDGRYHIARERMYLQDFFLEDSERAALLVAMLSVRHARTRLGSVGETFGGFGDLRQKIDGSRAPVEADLNVAVPVQVLYSAIREHRRIAGRYSGVDRILEPYGLLYRHGIWYLHALDTAAGFAKNFRVDRFETGPAATGDREAFSRPVGFDLSTAMPEGWQIPAEEPRQVVVRVEAQLAARAVLEVGPHVLGEWSRDGSVTLTMTVSHLGAFRSWLLSFGTHAIVESPPEIRAAIRAWLHEVVRGA